MAISQAVHEQVLAYQRNEVAEYHSYRQLARTLKSSENRRIPEKIDDEEKRTQQFFEMVRLSLSVAGLSFIAGLLVRKFLGVEI